jgi:uncharacterized protein
MSDDVSAVRKVIGVEEHAWTAELRDALVTFGGDDTVTMMSAQAGIDRRLLDVSDGRLARMDAAGVDMEILSITTPGTQPLRPAEAVPLARDANDFLADAVRAHPDRFAAFATLPTPEPEAAAGELERGVTRQTGADSRGRFGGSNGAREFVRTAPIDAQDKAKLAYLNAERLLLRRTA